MLTVFCFGSLLFVLMPLDNDNVNTDETLSAIVAMWYARSKKYGEKNVMYDSYAWYNHMLSDASEMKHMPEVCTGQDMCHGPLWLPPSSVFRSNIIWKNNFVSSFDCRVVGTP